MSFRPSRPTLIVTGIAAFAVAAGAAYAASAKPDRGGAEAAASLSPATTVKPGSFFHSAAFGLSDGSGCVAIARPPAGQALIVTQVRVDVFNDPTPAA
jgi:hypothetical protein